MAECMDFPETVEGFMEQYKITDTKQIYTNGDELVPIFRMKQWIQHCKTADVRPVVRCKDCKWWVSEKAYCRIQDNYIMGDDDFCSNGAPKEVNNG